MANLAEVSATIDTKRISVKRPRIASALGWSAFALGLLPLFVVMVAAGLFQWSKPDWWGEFLGVTWLSAGVSTLAALFATAVPGRSWMGARTTVDESGLTVTPTDQAKAVRLPSNISCSVVVPGFGAVLELDDGRSVNVETSDDNADALVSALRASAGERRLETRMRPGIWRGLMAGGTVPAVYALAANLNPRAHLLTRSDVAVVIISTLVLLALTVLGTRPPQIEVGADGVMIHRRIRKRFIRFSEIAHAKLLDRTLRIQLHDGSDAAVGASAQNLPQLVAAHRRLLLGLAAHADGPAAPARLALLDRNDRSLPAWRDELAALLQRDSGFRSSPLSRDDIDAILSAPNTSSEHRIAAALALRAVDGVDAEPRIRIAAEACAQPEIREALLRVAATDASEADDEAAAIDEALAAEAPAARTEDA